MTASNFIDMLEEFLSEELTQVEGTIKVGKKYNLPTILMTNVGERHALNKILTQIVAWKLANSFPTTNPSNSDSYSEYLDPPILW